MSYASIITLKDAAAANVVFNRIRATVDDVVYADSASTLSQPNLLTIGHKPTNSISGSDRHMVKLAKTSVGTDNIPRTIVCTMSLSVPRQTLTRTDVNNVLAGLKEFIGTIANVDALLRNEL